MCAVGVSFVLTEVKLYFPWLYVVVVVAGIDECLLPLDTVLNYLTGVVENHISIHNTMSVIFFYYFDIIFALVIFLNIIQAEFVNDNKIECQSNNHIAEFILFS